MIEGDEAEDLEPLARACGRGDVGAARKRALREPVDLAGFAYLLAFGVDPGTAVLAVLAYRAIAFWLPTLPGAIAYFQLRRTMGEWKAEQAEAEAELELQPAPARVAIA